MSDSDNLMSPGVGKGPGEKPRVLITGSRSFPALYLVRAFGAAGHEVFSADSRLRTVAEKSRYVRQHFLLPPPAEDPVANLSRVAELAVEHGIDLIVPTCEEGFFLSQYREMLPPGCGLFSDSIQKLGALHNKFTFSVISPEFGAPSPETHLLRDSKDLEPFEENPEAWVFKPIFSRFSAFTLISPSREELGKVTILPGNPWIAQRKVAGREFSCYGIAREGRLLAFSSYETPYRLGHGGGVYLVNRSHRTPGLLEFTRRVVQGFSFTGQIAFDFMEGEDGELWVIECNPRSTNGVWMFAEHQPVEGLIANPPSEGSEVVIASSGIPRMVGMIMRLYCAPQARRQGRFREWARAHRHGKDVLFSRRDPGPYLSRFRGLGRFRDFIRARRRGESGLGLASRDMDWSNPQFVEEFGSREELRESLAEFLPGGGEGSPLRLGDSVGATPPGR